MYAEVSESLCAEYAVFSIAIQTFAGTNAQIRACRRRLRYIRILNDFYAFQQWQYLFRQGNYTPRIDGFGTVDDTDMVLPVVPVVTSF